MTEMNKKSIFEAIKSHLSENAGLDNIVIMGDQVKINYKIEETEFSIIVRCQNFGDIYLINTKSIRIRRDDLEKRFQLFLLEELKKYYNDEFTLAIDTDLFGINNVISDFKIETERDLQNLNKFLEIFFKDVRDNIFYNMTDIKAIASYISKYNYENNLKVLVGGHFPVQNLKKIFLLFEGDQMVKYEEYKQGLIEQIESFPKRKPSRKDEARFFIENFNYLISKLETRDGPKPIA